MGTRIGIWNGRAGRGFTGTPSCMLLGSAQTGSLMLLASRHVVAPFHLGEGGYMSDTIFCERVDATAAESVPAGEIVTFTDFAVDPSRTWSLDAALVRIRNDYRDWVLRAFKAVGLPAGIGTVVEGDAVTIAGRFSAEAGTVREADAQRSLSYSIDSGGAKRTTKFSGLIVTDAMSVPGDSGASLRDRQGRIVGLLVGGDAENESAFFKVRVALDYFKDRGLGIVTGDHAVFAGEQTLPPAEPVAPLASIGATAASAMDLLARTLWGEARGESPDGLRAVASVIVNRAGRRPRWWWGSSIEEVCVKPFQFSCWNLADPNRTKLLAVDTSNAAFRDCLRVAAESLSAALVDRTSGATHYHHLSILPTWAVGHQPSVRIGRHQFYNDIEPAPT